MDVTFVGMRFRGGHYFQDKDNVTLAPEPENQYDANAIKVLVNGDHVAYVARDQTNGVKPYLDRDYKLHFIEQFAASAKFRIK